jgi:diguanylate cyclase (GGDEF)-like protein
MALILLDVDGLKLINDSCGHQAGDELLAAIGGRLAGTSDSAYRIGGDEFAILIDRAAGQVAAPSLQRLDPVRLRFLSCGHEHSLSLSYGYASSLAGESFDGLFRRADVRLREFKQRLYGSGGAPDRRGRATSSTIADPSIPSLEERRRRKSALGV